MTAREHPVLLASFFARRRLICIVHTTRLPRAPINHFCIFPAGNFIRPPFEAVAANQPLLVLPFTSILGPASDTLSRRSSELQIAPQLTKMGRGRLYSQSGEISRFSVTRLVQLLSSSTPFKARVSYERVGRQEAPPHPPRHIAVRTRLSRQRSYHRECTGSRPITEVKRGRAGLVL